MILRPIRESFGAKLGSQEINRLFFAVFLTMLMAVPIFGRLVSLVKRQLLLQLVFHFFALNIVLFGVAAYALEMSDSRWMSRIYFVWLSVFNLFVMSLFWSVMADLFSAEQAKRLFGPIVSGATTGAICGSAFTAWASTHLGVGVLMFISAGLLELSLVFAAGFCRTTKQWPNQQPQKKSTPNVWAGVQLVVKSRYLIMICLYLALTSACGAAVYLQMAEFVGQNISEDSERTKYFATLNLFAQIGTLVLQLFVVGAVMRRISISVALMVLPVIYLSCFFLLGFWQSLLVFGIVDVLRRAFVYGMSVPAREVLFTVVDRDAKYKSKNFIDTVVFRGSDAASSTAFVTIDRLLTAPKFLNFFVIPLAVVWVVVGWFLGQKQIEMQTQKADATETKQ